MLIPLGVVCIVFEARPNVTADAGALCFKSGNAVILGGGKEALATSKVIAGVLKQVLLNHKLPPELITLVPGSKLPSSLNRRIYWPKMILAKSISI
jgi:glutamate-5-semialdehyde dehydrogenase